MTGVVKMIDMRDTIVVKVGLPGPPAMTSTVYNVPREQATEVTERALRDLQARQEDLGARDRWLVRVLSGEGNTKGTRWA